MSVQLDSISKGYAQSEKKVEVLKDLSFSVQAGETVAILGESGSGKSTLLALLAGLDKPDSGTIRVDGEAISHLDETQLASFRSRNLGIVFQQFHLMQDLTALENVALPLELARVPDAEERARQMLAQVGLTERVNHFPRQLSGGECQRVAIARALVARPKLLLADEPTGNLDLKTAEKIAELFFSLVKQLKSTLILVTHSEALAHRCSRVARLSDGRLA